ncbi:MAG TPA: hypothetical protein VEX15_22665 [Nocardioidaceae bacterium]|nr:hypothetical protein [Nocardioidaceae bacterium]
MKKKYSIPVFVLFLIGGLAACGGSAADTTDDPSTVVDQQELPPAVDADGQKGFRHVPRPYDLGAIIPEVAPIVGRWQLNQTCQQFVDALEAEGLGVLAPYSVGGFFPNQTREELLAKDDLCSGAKPQLHSHFFTEDGMFGSLDQYENQVDDGTYVIVDSDTFRIGDYTWDYQVQGGTLELMPVITEKYRREALRHPDADWVDAAYLVGVAFPGAKWKNVPCEGWC